MPNLRGPELLILVLIIVVLFGAKRLPDVARGLGRSMRIFKSETKGLVEPETVPDEQPAEISAAQQPSPEQGEESTSTPAYRPQEQQAQPPGRA